MGAPVYNAVPSDFASRIKQLRQKYGLTQANLAEHLGVSYVTVNRWENEVARPSARLWRQIAKTELLGFAASLMTLMRLSPSVRKGQATR